MALCEIVWHFSPGLAPQAGHSKSIAFNMHIVYPDCERLRSGTGEPGSLAREGLNGMDMAVCIANTTNQTDPLSGLCLGLTSPYRCAILCTV